MRAVVIRSLAVIGVGAVILAGVLYVASTVDARPPQVLGVELTNPMPDDPRLALITTSVEILFSEPVETDTAVAAVSLTPPVDGSVSWSGSSMIFTPTEPLALDTEYTLTVAEGITDPAGNEMTELPAPFVFQTTGRPAVVETDPEDGTEEVALDATVSLRFSMLMDTASVEAELRLRPAFPHELRWSEELLEIVPTAPLRANQRYEVSIGADAADLAGVTLGEAVSLAFRTVPPGLQLSAMVPADGIDGIAPTSPIALIFDRPIAPSSVSPGMLTTTPEIAGTLEVVALPGETLDDGGSGRVLRFTPSGPIPPNTTVRVELAPGLATPSGGQLSRTVTWSFTTGAPGATLSNKITFISDRAGVANLWAMNPDGTGQHQLSIELVPVTDYAVAPDGTSYVVGDGRRLVFSHADGSDRRVLTDEGLIDFDPAYSPDARRIAFGRADAATGEGLGLWQWDVDGGDPTRIELPAGPAPGSGASGDPQAAAWLRAPTYAPDGAALAYVDPTGRVGILELPDEELTAVDFLAAAPPVWLPDSSGVLLTGVRGATAEVDGVEAPVAPLVPAEGLDIGLLARGGTRVAEIGLEAGSRILAVSAEGEIAYRDASGRLRIGAARDETGRVPPGAAGVTVGGAAFGPAQSAIVLVVQPADTGDGVGQLELLDLETGERSVLARAGRSPAWLP